MRSGSKCAEVRICVIIAMRILNILSDVPPPIVFNYLCLPRFPITEYQGSIHSGSVINCFVVFQVITILEKFRTEVSIDEAPESIETTQRGVEQWEQQRESALQFSISTLAEGQRLLQDLRYVHMHYVWSVCAYRKW